MLRFSGSHGVSQLWWKDEAMPPANADWFALQLNAERCMLIA